LTKIAAQYIGTDTVILVDAIDLKDGNGNPITKSTLDTGDTLMMDDFDILGETFLYDGMGGVQNLGVGRVILPQDAGLTDAQLAARGYQFSSGRSDFIAI